MAKGDAKEFHIQIQLPGSGFRKLMYFNRFRVEQEDAFCVIYFGHFSGGLMIDSYCCALPVDALKSSQNVLLNYLQQIGHPKSTSPEQQAFVSKDGQTGIADVIAMSRRGEVGETGLGMFSMIRATGLGPASEGKTFEADAVILLRSSIEMQRQLITALYGQ